MQKYSTNQKRLSSILEGETKLNRKLEAVRFRIPFPIISKQRPRVTFRNGKASSYYSKTYQQFLKDCTAILLSQWGDRSPLKVIYKLKIEIEAKTTRGDIDNLAGSIMDCIVKAKIVENDNVSNIPRLEANFRGKFKDEAITDVTILYEPETHQNRLRGKDMRNRSEDHDIGAEVSGKATGTPSLDEG